MNLFKVVFFSVISCLVISCGNNATKKDANSTDTIAKIEEDTRPQELRELTRKILNSPENASFYNDRATYYLKNQAIDKAYEDLGIAFSIDSLNPLFYITLSNYYIEKQEPANARTALEDGLKKNPDHVALNLQLGEFLMIARKHELSFKAINNALRKDKYNARGYFLKGMNYKELSKKDKAISSFQTAIEQNPDYYDAYMQLGLLYAKENNKLAPQYFSSAISVQEKKAEAWYARAMYYQENNTLNKAISDYKAILKFDSTYFNAWYNLGYLQFNKSNYDSAYYYFDKGVLANSSEPRGYYMRGLCMEQLGDKQKAIIDYENVLKLNANYTLAIQGLQRVKN